MKPALQRLLSDYGMVFVLLLLCALFSAITLTEQNPTGEAAARQVASALERSPGKGGRVLIAVRPQADDTIFARQLEQALTNAGMQVTVVSGEPHDAREALQRLA